MRKLSVFNQVSLDGYFVDGKGDMSWAKKDDDEWNAFAADNARGGGILVFGRVTYDLMKGFWPTPQAMKLFPIVAERMNSAPKIVFSRTLDKAAWSGTTLLKGDPGDEIRRLKKESDKDMAILGSGSIVAQLAEQGLIDEYQVVVNPIALGKGRTMFEGVKKSLNFRLNRTRTFRNGNVVLFYEAST